MHIFKERCNRPPIAYVSEIIRHAHGIQLYDSLTFHVHDMDLLMYCVHVLYDEVYCYY